MSRRASGLPAIFHCLGSLSGTSFGGVTLAAAVATLPNETRRLLGRWVITLLAAKHSAAGTPPLGGRSGDQHLARRGTAFAHIVMRLANAAAAARREIAPHAIAGEVVTGRWIFGGHLGPVALQLFGDELRQTGERSLAHLGAGNAHDDCVIGFDHDPCVHLRSRSRGPRGLRERHVKAQGQSADGRGGADQKTAARDRCCCQCHGAALKCSAWRCAEAASLMASRTRL